MNEVVGAAETGVGVLELRSGIKLGKLTKHQIAKLDVFLHCDPRLIADFVANATAYDVAMKVPLIERSDVDSNLYLILEGEVRVSSLAPSGRELTYQVLQPGDFFGEVAAIDSMPRSASVIAISNARVAVLGQVEFYFLLEKHPEFVRIVLERLARLARWLTDKVYEYHNYAVKGRICMELLRLAEDSDTNPPSVQIADQDMASRVGTNRENVTRIYGALRKQGLIKRKPPVINILDKAGIEAVIYSNEFA